MEAERITLQVLATTSKTAAENLVRILKEQAVEASIAEVHDAGATTYRVRTGSFASAGEAQQLAEELKGKGFQGWMTPERDTPAQAAGISGDNTSAAAAHQTQAAPTSIEIGAAARPEQTTSLPPEAGPEPFVLVISPAPSFTDEPLPAQAAAQASGPVYMPAALYKYTDPADGIIHVTNAEEKIPPLCKPLIQEIGMFPVYYVKLDLQTMSVVLKVEGQTRELLLDGIKSTARRLPSSAEVHEFETLMQAGPLRIRYYPSRSDPDGALHGALYFMDGAPVDLEMVRRGLAICATDQLPAPLRGICLDAEQAVEGRRTGQSTPH